MADPNKYVHEVVITFKDKTKIQFFGVITELKFESGKVVAMKWRNVDYQQQGSLQSKRLRFVDITAVRSITERCIDTSGKHKFDPEEYEVVDGGSK